MGVCLKTMTAYPGIWSIRDYQKDFHPSDRIKADPAQFRNWQEKNKNLIGGLITPCDGDPRWGVIKDWRSRIICLDPDSPYAGNIYNNNSKSLVCEKLRQSLCIRPIHMVAYTLYNATLIHAAVIIFKGIKDQKPASETLQKVVCSLADIVRTPVYGVAIMIITVAAVLSESFRPELVYDFRAVIGRLNRELGWGEKKGFHDFMPCMQPYVNIMEFTLNDQTIDPVELYENTANPVLVGLTNLRLAETRWEEWVESKGLLDRLQNLL